ncbi:MAG: M67 family metallopeptidase [Candidatus Eisenbacteria bacterium]|nr:M67 family metallopeptidase [Candidatus Eisenbacteria bacterium]
MTSKTAAGRGSATSSGLMIRPTDLEAIRRHGEDGYPNESCGLLLGRVELTGGVRVKAVTSVDRLENERDDSRHNRFLITPATFLSADRAARQRGVEILGFYHSHPNAPATPSEFDREHAWPFYSYVIVSVVNGDARELNSWVLAEDRTHYNAEPIVPARED